MRAFNPRISKHAIQRMAQRNLTVDDLEVVMRFGYLEYRTGAEFYFLRRRDLPEEMERTFARLVGTAVLIKDGCVITVYRNQHALSQIKRKLKHFSQPNCFPRLLAGSFAPERARSEAAACVRNVRRSTFKMSERPMSYVLRP